MEGMRGFVARHRATLAPERTRFVCVESVGSEQLVVIEGEGMLRMRDYSEPMREALGRGAERAGVPIRRGLRLGLATDGLISLRAGYETATIASVNAYRFPANYHSMSDTAANVDYETVRRATATCEAVVREADERVTAR